MKSSKISGKRGEAATRVVPVFMICMLLLSGAAAVAQEGDVHRPLRFITRLAGTGSTDLSDPEGYTAYSSLHLDASLRWPLSNRLAAGRAAAVTCGPVPRAGPAPLF